MAMSKRDAIIAAAREFGVDPNIALRQLGQESGESLDTELTSSAGAKGPGQFMPDTGNAVADAMGIPRSQFWADPYQQIRGAMYHMSGLLKEFDGDYPKALAAYNAGSGAVKKYGGVPPFEETQTYVKNILGKAAAGAVGGATPAGPVGAALGISGKAKEAFSGAVGALGKLKGLTGGKTASQIQKEKITSRINTDTLTGGIKNISSINSEGQRALIEAAGGEDNLNMLLDVDRTISQYKELSRRSGIPLEQFVAAEYGIDINDAKRIALATDQLGVERDRLKLDSDLGFGRLGLDRERLGLDTMGFEEGRRQFDEQFSEDQFRDRRDFEESRDRYAQDFAEQQRQFNTTEERQNRSLDLEGELGRGRLALDTELGRADAEQGSQRLALDTELGRGQLELGKGRLGLDTELGRGQLDLGKRAADLDLRRFRAEVLSRPSDYVASAFERRGMASPTGRITHQDILGDLTKMADGGVTSSNRLLVGENGPEIIEKKSGNRLQVHDTHDTMKMLASRMAGQKQRMVQQDVQRRLANPQGSYSDQGQDFGGGYPDLMNRAPGPDKWAVLAEMFKPQDNYAYDPQGFADLAARTNVTNQQSLDEYNNGASRFAIPMAEGGVINYNGETFNLADQGGRDSAQRVADSLLTEQIGLRGAGDSAGVQALQRAYGTGSGAARLSQVNDLLAQFRGQGIIGTDFRAGDPRYDQSYHEDAIGAARRLSPPAVTAALEGRNAPTYRPSTTGLTLQRIAQLTPGELEALNTRLGVEFNTTLEDEIAGLQQRFGTATTRPRARLAL